MTPETQAAIDRLTEILHTDRWCICPFSVVDYPHMTSCPLGIAAELLALLPPEAPRDEAMCLVCRFVTAPGEPTGHYYECTAPRAGTTEGP